MRITDCSCGVRIFFAKNEKTGSLEPIVAEPKDDGNIEIVATGEHKGMQIPVVRHMTKDMMPLFRNGDRFISHFADCPHADRYRRNQQKGASQ